MFPNSNDPWSGWIPTFLVPLITGIFILLSKLPIKAVIKKLFIIIYKEAKRVVRCLSFERRATSSPINKKLEKRVFIFCGKGSFDEKFKYFERKYTQNIYCYININLSTINANNIKDLCFFVTKNIISFISEEEKYGKNDLIKEFERKWDEWNDMESFQDNLSIMIIDFLNNFRETHRVNKKKENSYLICIRNFDSIASEKDKVFLIKDIINPFSKRGINFFIDSKECSDSDLYYNGDKNVHIDKNYQ